MKRRVHHFGLFVIIASILVISCRKEIVRFSNFGKENNYARLIECKKISDSVVNFSIRKNLFLKDAEFKFISLDSGLVKYSFPITESKIDSAWKIVFNTNNLRSHFRNSTDSILVEFFALDMDGRFWKDSVKIEFPKIYVKINNGSSQNDSIYTINFSKNVVLSSSELLFYELNSNVVSHKLTVPNFGTQFQYQHSINLFEVRKKFNLDVKKVKVVYLANDIYQNKIKDSIELDISTKVQLNDIQELNDSIYRISILKNVALTKCQLSLCARDSFKVKKVLIVNGNNNNSPIFSEFNILEISKLFSTKVAELALYLNAEDKRGIKYTDSIFILAKFNPNKSSLFKSFGGLKAYWPLEIDIQDYSGNNQNGNSNNGVTFKRIPGTNINAGYFNGNSNVVVPHSATLSAPSHTICAIVSPEDILQFNQGHIISKREESGWGNEFEFVLYKESSTEFKVASQWTAGWKNNSNASSSKYSFNTQLHVCVTHDNSDNIIYVNGEKESQIASGGLVGSNTYDVSIGRRWTNGYSPFKGYIKDVALWGKALSATEIKQISDSYK